MGRVRGWGGVVGCPGYVELGDDGQGVGEGECGGKEVRDGRGREGERGRESDLVHSGHQLWEDQRLKSPTLG